MGFGAVDAGIVGVYLLGVTLAGSLAGRKLKSTQDYFLAGRRAPWWLSAFSIVATETSTLTFVAVPGIAYAGNFTFLQVAAGFLLGRILVAWWMVPAYMKGDLQTSYELLQTRLGTRARRSASGVFCLTRLLGDGVRLFSACVVFKEVLAWMFGPWQGNELAAVAVVGGLTLVYTFAGGMRAVLWTDLVQLFLYLGGALVAVLVAAAAVPGGFGGVVESALQAGKLQWLNADLGKTFFDGYSLLGGLLGGAFLSLASHGTDQLIVQRLLSCKGVRSARAAVVASGVLVLFQMAFFLFVGLTLWAFYRAAPGGPPAFARPDDVFPHFLVTNLPSGLSGLIVAAAFAAAMSTLSGSLNSLASATVNDFYRPLTRDRHPEGRYLRAGRWATLVWGLLLMGVAVPARGIHGLLDAGLGIAGITSGGVLGLFLLSKWKGKAPGGVAGMWAAILVCGILWAGPRLHWTWVPPFHWTWFTPIGTAVVFLVSAMVAVTSRFERP
ncbi:MAG TPA: sodium:solute symporter [Planctomycetes bacterium]|nr:sodium:solute symporter [Planctomycetota bacterium]